MIIFKKLTVRNLLKFGDNESTFILNKSKISVIVGDNGVGKSTICDGICFALFGKAFRKIVKSKLVNTANKKNCVVTLEFSIFDKDYKIIRGIAPDIFEIYECSKLIEQTASLRDYQAILENNILKMSYPVFTQLIMVGKATYTPFMEYALNDRRIFVEKMLNLTIYRLMSEKNKVDIQTLNIHHNKLLSDQKPDKYALELILDEIVSITEHVDGFDGRATAESDNITTLTNNSIKLNSEIDNLKKQIDDFVILHEKDSSIFDTELFKLNKVLSTIVAEARILKKNKDFLSQHSDCPTCKQLIDDKFKSKYLNDIESELSSHKIKYKKTELEIESINSKIVEIKNHNKLANENIKKYDSLTNNLKSLEKELLMTDRQIDSIKHADKNDTDDHLNFLIKRRDDLFIKRDDLSAKIKDREDELIIVKSELDILEKSSFALKDTGIKSKVIDSYIPTINNLMSKYISELNVDMTFEIDKDFNDIITVENSDPISYFGLSEGQKLRINLAMLLTWREISKLQGMLYSNLIFFDETLDSSLDPSGAEAFCQMLYHLVDNNIFIITHTPDKLETENIIKFVNEDGFSKIT